MAEYVKGIENEKEDIIDFINYAFSQSGAPHDFKTLLPKAYADDIKGLGAVHYLAKENGKIKGVVADRIVDISVNGNILKTGLIGSVSTHMYSRGEGYMKQLMKNAVEEAKQIGVDILVLGGQRQRYGYFGFESAGVSTIYFVTKTNIRHCLADISSDNITFRDIKRGDLHEIDCAKKLYEKRPVYALREIDEFWNIMHSWNGSFRAIYKSGELIGYCYNNFEELILSDEKDFPCVMKALFDSYNLRDTYIPVRFYEKERVAFLSEICENMSITNSKMINILNWKKVLEIYFKLQSENLSLHNGEVKFTIDNAGYCVKVTNGLTYVEEVEETENIQLRFTHNKAQQIFFGVESLLDTDNQFRNWLPLPFYIDTADAF